MSFLSLTISLKIFWTDPSIEGASKEPTIPTIHGTETLPDAQSSEASQNSPERGFCWREPREEGGPHLLMYRDNRGGTHGLGFKLLNLDSHRRSQDLLDHFNHLIARCSDRDCKLFVSYAWRTRGFEFKDHVYAVADSLANENEQLLKSIADSIGVNYDSIRQERAERWAR
jgi:hypothetical protein